MESGGEVVVRTPSTMWVTSTTVPRTTTTTRPHLAVDGSWVAWAIEPEVVAYAQPDGIEPIGTFTNPSYGGGPLVFLVEGRYVRTDWIQVHLPARPNGSVGWVRASDVDVVPNDYRVRVNLTAYTLTVTKAGQPVLAAPIGVGQPEMLPPVGTSFITAYGPNVFRLSGIQVTDDVIAQMGRMLPLGTPVEIGY
jgi:hypothetical protein